MAQAEREPDAAKRTALLQAAEKIALADMPWVPIRYLSQSEAVGPRVGGYIANARDAQPQPLALDQIDAIVCPLLGRRPHAPDKPPPFLISAVALAALVPQALSAQTKPRIGVIGAGKIGGQLARFWAHAGYPVMVSSLNLDEMKKLAADIGHGARAGTAREAAAFGQVIVISVPFGALPQVGRDYAAELKGKIVLDTTNPYVSRDGEMANEAIQKGTGAVVPTYLPGVRLVRAFNQIGAAKLEPLSKASRRKTGVPLASDDAEGHARRLATGARCRLRTGGGGRPCHRQAVRCRQPGLYRSAGRRIEGPAMSLK